MNSWRHRGPAGALADEESAAPTARAPAPRVHQRVVEHEVRRGEPLGRTPRQQPGIARPGADQRHEATRPRPGRERRTRPASCSAPPPRAVRSYSATSASSSSGRRSAIGTLPRQPVAPRLARAGHPRLEVVRQQRLERFAHQPDQRRRLAIGRHRHRHAGAPDDARPGRRWHSPCRRRRSRTARARAPPPTPRGSPRAAPPPRRSDTPVEVGHARSGAARSAPAPRQCRRRSRARRP